MNEARAIGLDFTERSFQAHGADASKVGKGTVSCFDALCLFSAVSS